MKYEGTKQVGEDQDYTAYMFSFRRREVEVLFATLTKILNYIPNITETQIFRSRLGNINKCLAQTLPQIKKCKAQF